ncbi:hypothetical protein [Rhizobium sp. TRM95796]|uniref:hypothetical protein n=1 Tax=Rhizobium sp. TRM95796 TaxID=2979862 RepID=UPI0021E74BD4|nr:hypothetical protein [Rhizobium sp. TRM95796]MCV3768896.1 hypothetical protein [Rhizobium sp. TRM95796]
MPDFNRIQKDDLVAELPGVFDDARYTDVGVGWLGLVREFVAEALPHDSTLTVYELKEKWGSLRIWADTDVLGSRLAKAKAEIKSACTCEACGAEGFIRRPPPTRMAWWKCLCDEHASEDQRAWGARRRESDGMMQIGGQWYRYDAETDSMVPCEPPERFR